MYIYRWYQKLHNRLKQAHNHLLSSPIGKSIKGKFYYPNPILHILYRKILLFPALSTPHLLNHSLYSMMYTSLGHYVLHSGLKLGNIFDLPLPIWQNIQDISDYPNPIEHILHQMEDPLLYLKINIHLVQAWILCSRWGTSHRHWKFYRNQRQGCILEDPLPTFQSTANKFGYPNPTPYNQDPD